MSKLIVPRAKISFKKIAPVELTLNFMSLEDESWMTEQFGDSQHITNKLTKELDVDMLLRIFWRLLDDESKEKIIKMPVNIWTDDDEEPKKIAVKEPIKKLKCLVSGVDEMLAIYTALGETKAKSLPDVKDSEKKSLKGEGSSQIPSVTTSLPENTVTPLKNSQG